MADLKIIPAGGSRDSQGPFITLQASASSAAAGPMPSYGQGMYESAAGPVLRVSTVLTSQDRWEHVKCRTSGFRNRYEVRPGLYAVGSPDADADVFVSANYKLSFDHLRRALDGSNAWLLVLDTKGINVWCAAGKGTFGTEELVRRISASRLASVVSHRRIIVPQLGAPGIRAHEVTRRTGFRVMYGPVRANDIPAYLDAGRSADRRMREIRFSLADRLILTPMEINPAMKDYFPWYAAAVLIIFGLQPSGIIFRDVWLAGVPFVLLGLMAVFAGAFLTPVLLPFVPFRSFAMKGLAMGAIAILPAYLALPVALQGGLLRAFTWIFFPLASSYIALQFTGSTTFTGMSGVKKELKIAIPIYVAGLAISVILLIGYKLIVWGVIA